MGSGGGVSLSSVSGSESESGSGFAVPLVISGYSEYPLMYQDIRSQMKQNQYEYQSDDEEDDDEGNEAENENENETVEGLEISENNTLIHISKLFEGISSKYNTNTTNHTGTNNTSISTNTTANTSSSLSHVKSAISSIFVCNVLYTSTINQLLFHNVAGFRQIGCTFCILPTLSEDNCKAINNSIENSHENPHIKNSNSKQSRKSKQSNHGPRCATLSLPTHQILDNIHFISLKSMRNTSTYLILDMVCKNNSNTNSGGNGSWDFVNI